MSDDWEGSGSSSEESSPKPKTPAKAPIVKKVPTKKFAGEDEEDSGPASDWEASSESEEEAAPKAVTAAPAKKKGTLKAKLAEKEAERARRVEEGEEDSTYDEDAVLDPRAKARLDRERELKSDLNNAAELFGQAAISGTSSNPDLNDLLAMNPRTKEELHDYSNRIMNVLITRIQDKPLYTAFVEHHVRALAGPLRDVDTRKAASALTTLANEKQKEARDKASGKKKTNNKASAKSTKVSGKVDTKMYDEALDDFGNEPDDFM